MVFGDRQRLARIVAKPIWIWLSPDNFDAKGQQRERLSDLTRLVIHGESDPALSDAAELPQRGGNDDLLSAVLPDQFDWLQMLKRRSSVIYPGKPGPL